MRRSTRINGAVAAGPAAVAAAAAPAAAAVAVPAKAAKARTPAKPKAPAAQVASAAAVELEAQWHEAAPKSAVDLCKGLFLSYAQAIAKDTAAKKALYVKMFDAVEAKVKEGVFTQEDSAALKAGWALAPARKPRKPRERGEFRGGGAKS